MSEAPTAADGRRAAVLGFMSAHNLKVKTWAEDADVSASALYNFLNGRSASLGQETLEKLADAAGVSVGEIISASPPPEPTSTLTDGVPLDAESQRAFIAKLTDSLNTSASTLAREANLDPSTLHRFMSPRRPAKHTLSAKTLSAIIAAAERMRGETGDMWKPQWAPVEAGPHPYPRSNGAGTVTLAFNHTISVDKAQRILAILSEP